MTDDPEAKSTTAVNSPRPINAVSDLLALLELKGIRFYEFSGRIVDQERPGVEDFNITLQQKQDPMILEVRFKLTARQPLADFVVDVATIYESTEPISFDIPVAQQFIEKVAIMAAFPFLREGLLAAAGRISVPAPLLGIMRAGNFKIDQVGGGDDQLS